MNLPQQISQLDSIIRQQAGQRRQTFTVNTHLQHENVLADPNRLNRVLMNILSNAVKYTPTGGHIRFEVDELPRNEHYARYRFVVQDDGIGMSEAYQKTLLTPLPARNALVPTRCRAPALVWPSPRTLLT